MNRTQRIARFNLMVIVIGGGLALLTILISLAAGSRALAYCGFLILGLAALVSGLSQLIVRKESGKVSFDERDAAIEKKAYLAGYATLLCAFIPTCMIAGPHLGVGAAILAVTLVLVKVVESVVILVEHGRELDGVE